MSDTFVQEGPQADDMRRPLKEGVGSGGKVTWTEEAAGERHIPFLAWLGARRERVADGEAVVVVDLVPELLNNHGGGHGGVVMTLLDNAMANAALSRIAFTREVVTIDIHVAFISPATGRLTATGRATGGGRSVCFCEADIADANGHLVARAMGTFRYREPGGTHIDDKRDAR